MVESEFDDHKLSFIYLYIAIILQEFQVDDCKLPF